MIDEDNCGWVICSIDIPDDKYAQGYNYYGISMSNTSKGLSYEYFSWCMTQSDLKKFEEYMK